MEWRNSGVQKHLYANGRLVGTVNPHRTLLRGTIYHWMYRRVNGAWSPVYECNTEEEAMAYVEKAIRKGY